METLSRNDLLTMAKESRANALKRYVDAALKVVARRAKRGETRVCWDEAPQEIQLKKLSNARGFVASLTVEEFMTELRARLPGCTVQRTEGWVDVDVNTSWFGGPNIVPKLVRYIEVCWEEKDESHME